MNSLKNKIIIKWHHLKNKPWHEIIDRWFNTFALLEQDDESKRDISLRITNGVRVRKLYWIEILLSALIATFGLLQNSVAVIIGAMLIAPLMRPIQAMAFGVSLGRTSLFMRATKLLTFSVIFSVGMGYIVTKYVPLQLETSEILARTAPNLFDLFIAGASAMIAFLAVAYKRLIESVAGVAMAASLMPPLAVTGIELSFGLWSQAWGSFLLFITNLVAILLVGAVMFVLYGFNPHEEDTPKTLRNFGVIFLLIMILWIPLFSSLKTIENQHNIEKRAQMDISQELQEINATLKQLSISNYTSQKVSLSGEIRVPEGTQLPDNFLSETIRDLNEHFKQKISVSIDVIRTTTLGE